MRLFSNGFTGMQHPEVQTLPAYIPYLTGKVTLIKYPFDIYTYIRTLHRFSIPLEYPRKLPLLRLALGLSRFVRNLRRAYNRGDLYPEWFISGI